jgi:anti-sigma factor RsiW
MECKTVQELLGNYLDEELTEPMRICIESHLGTCPACSADLADLKVVIAELELSKIAELPSPWFAERLLQSLARSNNTSLSPVEQPTRDLQLGLW